VKVLVVHNRYRSAVPSGENVAVDRDVEALLAAGVEVVRYARSSDDVAEPGRLPDPRLLLRPTRSSADVEALDEVLRRERPDVVHVHNVFPLISPAVIPVAHRAGIPVVFSVHNYRLSCIAGTFVRDGRACRTCLRGGAVPGVVHGCYRGSRAQSAAMALAQVRHRTTWRSVDLALPVSHAVAAFLGEIGFARDRIQVRPNLVPDGGPPHPPGTGFLFAGRFDEVKGVDLLLDAWERAAVPTTLLLVGDGPLSTRVATAAAGRTDVDVRPPVAPAEVAGLIDRVMAVVVPSRAPEALPTMAVQALARGRAVLATDHPAIREVVDETVGWLVPPAPGPLAKAIVEACADGARRGASARARFDERFSPERSLSTLLGAYERVVGRCR
jgi:glycosyltransferase involved in cell wall biosynthesis